MSVNKAILLGYVGNDPELRYPQKDFPVARFTLATNEPQPQGGAEVTDWHNIVMSGQAALFAEKYIRKGTRLYIEGKLRTREYTDKFQINRKITSIYVETFELLGR